MCAISGVLILAMPIGIISSKFSKTLEKQKLEKHLIKFEQKNSKEINLKNQV